jgi:hypothetical protein
LEPNGVRAKRGPMGVIRRYERQAEMADYAFGFNPPYDCSE